jgi:chloride channel protein, CIC family
MPSDPHDEGAAHPRSAASRGLLALLLRLRVWISDIVHPTELQVTLFWAGIIGFAGAISSVAFRRLTDGVHWLLTHHHGSYVETFSRLEPWQRLAVPVIGGTLAGLAIFFGIRLKPGKTSTDYMEAIVVGDGVISMRLSLVKCVSAMFSIASGASIGREGPLVQLSAMIASVIGRLRKMPTLQLRLLVACGAAAGIASAYNAPIGGALFVAEIVLQSLAMETFGPLVFASVIATLTARQLLGGKPLYEIPPVQLNSSWEILPHLALGLLAGLSAPWFLRLLRASEKLFAKLPAPVYVRLALGGLIVGAIAVISPEVCGNGYSIVNGVLHGEWVWQGLLLILLYKLLATAATFGSGAVGGVFTPTLFVGACAGFVFCRVIAPVWPGPALVPGAFTLVGMGAFLAATTHAPLMAIIVLFELTLDYQIILPLMLACVIAHYTCLTIETKSVYSDSLKRKGAGTFREQLASLAIADLMKRDPVAVTENARFAQIAESFITHRFNYLYVVDDAKHFRGVVSLHDVKSYLSQPDLAEIILARDIMHEQFPTIAPEKSLAEALERFSRHDGERLPVVAGGEHGQLVGSISKTDLLLALAETTKGGAVGGSYRTT